jgi:cytochrome c553
MVVRLMRVACLAVALAACTAEQAPPPTRLSIKELMERVIDPPADRFWESSGTIITAAGEKSRAPTTDAGWQDAANAAATLVEAANLLMMPGRKRDDAEWMQYARQLQKTATAGMKAAQAKDEKAVFDTGGEIFLACRSCHMKYMLGYQ